MQRWSSLDFAAGSVGMAWRHSVCEAMKRARVVGCFAQTKPSDTSPWAGIVNAKLHNQCRFNLGPAGGAVVHNIDLGAAVAANRVRKWRPSTSFAPVRWRRRESGRKGLERPHGLSDVRTRSAPDEGAEALGISHGRF